MEFVSPSVTLAHSRSPLSGVRIARVSREDPPVTRQIHYPILPFAIDGLVQLFHNRGSFGNCLRVVRVHVVHNQCQRLCPVAEFRRA